MSADTDAQAARLEEHIRSRAELFRSALGGMLIFGIIAAYLCQPMLSLMDPLKLALAGLVLGTAGWDAYRASVFGKRWGSAVLSGLLGSGLICWTAVDAIGTMKRLDPVCRPIQEALVKGTGDIATAAARFQALGCRTRL